MVNVIDTRPLLAFVPLLVRSDGTVDQTEINEAWFAELAEQRMFSEDQ